MKRYRREHPLALRILASILVASGLFAVLVTGIQLYSQYRADLAILELRLNDAQSTFVRALEDAVWRLDNNLTIHTLEGVQQLPYVAYVWLETVDGAIHRQGEEVHSPYIEVYQYPLSHRFDDPPALPIPLGVLRVGVDRRPILDSLKNQAILTLALQILKTVIVSALILWILYRLLFRRLSHLQQTAKALTADDLHTPFMPETNPVDRFDELDDLCTVLDDMRLRLKAGIEGIREAQERERLLIERDSLTQLMNSKTGLAQAQTQLSIAEQKGEHLVLVAVAVKAFKPVIESLGVQYAELMIVYVAELLKKLFAEDAILARCADNQFFVTLRINGTDIEQIRTLMEKMRGDLSQPIYLHGHSIDTNCYAGIAISPGDGRDAHTLYKHALSAVYSAHAQRHRSRYLFFDPLKYETTTRRLKLTALISSAQFLEEFELHYQPIVDAKDKKLVGCEALARWCSDELGQIPPPEFIEVAEETGLIAGLGELILQKACLQAAHWRTLAPNMIISVNVSPLQIVDAHFQQIVENALALSGLPACALKLEVTEQLMLHDEEPLMEKLRYLQSLGVRLAIDDFGSGYASLNYLCGYPFELLKIDQSFVRHMLSEPGRETLVRTIVQLAHSLGLEVVAEGVESNELSVLLTEMGCDLLQGYCFSRPLPPQTFTDQMLGGDSGCGTQVYSVGI
ncbi:MAG: EAL domain-containing protein [Oceanospirillales bacterium]|nr:EAL domain-containing protein [Oceanospirillales bacterium]